MPQHATEDAEAAGAEGHAQSDLAPELIGGVGHRLPIVSDWADLVVSCATFGPHPPLGGEPVLAELERCLRPGGTLAMVGPEDPAWWRRRHISA